MEECLPIPTQDTMLRVNPAPVPLEFRTSNDKNNASEQQNQPLRLILLIESNPDDLNISWQIIFGVIWFHQNNRKIQSQRPVT